MKQHNRTEEQQKDYIFEIFLQRQKETTPERRQVYYSRLCEQIYKWYRDYSTIDVDEMGLEITKVINRFLKDAIIAKIPNDKEGFFKYLQTSVKREKAAFYRDHNERDIIKIPKEKKRKLKQVKDVIRMKESQLGRKLTIDECDQVISKWFKKQEYINLWNSLNVGSLLHASNDGNDEIDILDYVTSASDDPLVQYTKKLDMEAILLTVKSLIEKKQERSKACYRALFTLHCIETFKNFEMLYPVLDRQILEIWQKSGDKPTQYEIYQHYHPKAQKTSAEAMASKNISEFLADIETHLNEKKS